MTQTGSIDIRLLETRTGYTYVYARKSTYVHTYVKDDIQSRVSISYIKLISSWLPVCGSSIQLYITNVLVRVSCISVDLYHLLHILMAPKRTPIRVRGKKTKPVEVHDTSCAKPELSSPDATPTVRSIVKVAREKRQRGPPIMRLPNEILEQIFLQCDSVQLARASHVLGSRLSSLHTRMEMTIAAFRNIWDMAWSVGNLRDPRIPRADRSQQDLREVAFQA